MWPLVASPLPWGPSRLPLGRVVRRQLLRLLQRALPSWTTPSGHGGRRAEGHAAGPRWEALCVELTTVADAWCAYAGAAAAAAAPGGAGGPEELSVRVRAVEAASADDDAGSPIDALCVAVRLQSQQQQQLQQPPQGGLVRPGGRGVAAAAAAAAGICAAVALALWRAAIGEATPLLQPLPQPQQRGSPRLSSLSSGC